MAEPIVVTAGGVDARGRAIEIREFAHGPNPGPPLHVHHSDDEAWYVLEGSLRFRFQDRTETVGEGATVFAPAGVAHTYGNPGPGDVRYLLISTPRVFGLIEASHAPGMSADETAQVFRRHDSALLE